MKEWGGLAIAGERIQEISDSLRRLSKCFQQDFQIQKKLSERQKEQIFDNVCASLCHGCEQEEWCREYYSYDNFSAAMELLRNSETYAAGDLRSGEGNRDVPEVDAEEDMALERAAETEKISEENDLSRDFLKRCIHLDDFMYAATEEMIAAGGQLQLQNRMSEVRMLAGGQLMELSSVLRDFSEAIRRGKEAEAVYVEKLFTELRKHHIEMEDAVFLENNNAMLQILLTVRSRWSGCVTAREVAEIAGRAIGKRMRPEGNGAKILTGRFEVIQLSQEIQFKVFTGVARTAKIGSTVSGDNFSVKELPDAKMALMLSDGMGSGVRAEHESCMVIELLEEFLEVGFSVQGALRMVNTLFLTDFQNPSAVTADIILLNLYNGVAEFHKAGAAPAYLKRGSSVFAVSGSALPAGMFFMGEGQPEMHKLYQGDCLIMMTDGVLEALYAENKDQMMEGYLSMLSVRGPQEMAERILKFAQEHEVDGPHDDMTVLVASVYENRKKKRRLFL